MITLKNLPLPCPENRRMMPAVRQTKTGRSYNGLIRSPEARKKAQRLVICIHEQLGGRPHAFKGACMVAGKFWYARKSNIPDADAYTKEIMDCLTKAGVWVDDTQCIQSPAIERMGPRYPGFLDLEIWEVNDDQKI